jgi:prepilin-type N-terminal cleavage/methylation domain-containing protein
MNWTRSNRDMESLQKGFGLLETAIAMVVVAALAGGALMFYSSNKHTQLGITLYEELMSMKNKTIKLYQGKPGYEGITEQILYDAGVIPEQMARGDGRFYHAGGQLMEMVPITAGCTAYPGCRSGFGLKYFGIESEVCEHMARQDYGGDAYFMWIGTDYHYAPFDKNALVASCAASNPAFRVFFKR